MKTRWPLSTETYKPPLCLPPRPGLFWKLSKKTHDLRELCRACQSLDPEFDKLVSACIDLSDYAVENRYPYPLELVPADVEKALRDAQLVRDFVLARIQKATP